MSGPLTGIKVLEFTEIVAGPLGGSLLTDMGADVIKVEPPWGDPLRLTQSIVPNEGRAYVALNRGKRSLVLDLTKPAAREVVYKLVPEMDVVLINYRPDVPEKLGIDYGTLSAINPRLIYCQNSAFGLKGPFSLLPGSDIVAQALSGLMASNNNVKEGVPQFIESTPLADVATAITIAWGITAALYHREKTGKGQKIEASLLSTALAIQTIRFMQVDAVDSEQRAEFLHDLERVQAEGKPFEEMQKVQQAFRPRPSGNIYYSTFKTKDGLITIGCLSDPPRKRMAEILGLDDIRWDEEYDATSPEARAFGEELTRQAEAKMLERTTEEWRTVFDEARVPSTPVYFTEELTDHQQVIADGNIVELEHPLLGRLSMYGPILQMGETPLRAQRSSPALSENTEEILTGLGYSSEELEQLRQEGATQ